MIKIILLLTFLCHSGMACANAPLNTDILNKALANTQIKDKQIIPEPSHASKYAYTQTEAYLKIMLEGHGAIYETDNLLENIKRFLDIFKDTYNNTPQFSPQHALNIIQMEKKYHDRFVLYNGLRGNHNFEWDILDRMRSVIDVAPSDGNTRNYGRIFNSLFLLKDTEGNTIPLDNVDKLIESIGANDGYLSYQVRAASTNAFLFGNTSKSGENTINYATQSANAHRTQVYYHGTILKWAFEKMGFQDGEALGYKSIQERLKRYEDLYLKTPALNRRSTIQIIFLTEDILPHLAYSAKPYGFVDNREFNEKKTKNPLDYLAPLREDPNKIKEYYREWADSPKQLASVLDRYQVRLLWEPNAIASGKMVIIPYDFYSSDPDEELKMQQELKNVKKEIDILILEDIADWMEIMEKTKSLPFNTTEHPLTKLRDIVRN